MGSIYGVFPGFEMEEALWGAAWVLHLAFSSGDAKMPLSGRGHMLIRRLTWLEVWKTQLEFLEVRVKMSLAVRQFVS